MTTHQLKQVMLCTRNCAEYFFMPVKKNLSGGGVVAWRGGGIT